jgi:hypothetical protein
MSTNQLTQGSPRPSAGWRPGYAFSAAKIATPKTVGIPDHAVGIDDRQPNPLIPRRVTAKFDSGAVEFINRLGLLKNTMAPICLKSRHIQARKSAEFGIRRALTEDRKVGRI